MIKSFADRNTQRIFEGCFVRRYSRQLQLVARRKLWTIELALCTHDLHIPPGNRLERLVGAQTDFYSIRINDQWRIRFCWNDATAEATRVEIVDYH